jgi:RNA polymerase-binding protein DksA
VAKSVAKAKGTSAKSAATRKVAPASLKLIGGTSAKTGPKPAAAPPASSTRKVLSNKAIASQSSKAPLVKSALPPAPVVKRPSKSELNGEPSAKAPIEAKTVSAKPGKVKSAESRSEAMRSGERNKFPENRPVPPPPVPTEGRPRKNQAGISSKDLEEYRMLLLAKRRELVGDMSAMEREALRSPGASNLSNLPIHMADMGTDNYEQEFTLGLVEKDRDLLREINQALAKIQDGTYGICEGTGKPISRARLEAQPWARYSIEHARLMERGGIRR